MPAQVCKECPQCGGWMRQQQIPVVVQIPGNLKPTTRTLNEWICPECDYFEEADEDGG